MGELTSIIDRFRQGLPPRPEPAVIDEAPDGNARSLPALVTDNTETGRTYVTVPVEQAALSRKELTADDFLLRLSGRLVEAERANGNGAFWTTKDLEFGLPSVATGPLNWLHQDRKIIGVLTEADLVQGREAAAENVGPHIRAGATVWAYLYGQEAQVIERAAEMNKLYFCVDDETEILTGDGWKRFEDLRVDEPILTLDRGAGTSRWTPVEKIHSYEVDEDLVSMEGQQHSSLTTSNHRWWVDRRIGTGRHAWEWRESADLGPSDYIPRSMPHGDFPAEAKYTDDFVELVAWCWTDAGLQRDAFAICQSTRANPGNVTRIDACLTRLGLGGRQREYAPPMATWRVPVSVSRTVLEVMDDRVPTGDFLRSLTRSQLALFVEVSMLADGTVAKADGQQVFYAETLAQAKAFEMACALLGQPTNTTAVKASRIRPGATLNGAPLRANKDIWRVCLVRRSDKIAPVRLARMGNGFTVTRERYTGKVWCPQTPDGTFLARRRGTVYWTGNSMECVSREVACTGPNGCGAQMPYLDALKRTEKACVHIRERASHRRFVDPIFQGAAIIVPPVKPGWADAHVELMHEAESHMRTVPEAAAFAGEDEALVASILEFVKTGAR